MWHLPIILCLSSEYLEIFMRLCVIREIYVNLQNQLKRK